MTAASARVVASLVGFLAAVPAASPAGGQAPARPRAADRGAPFPRIANCYGASLTPTSTPRDLDEIARCDLLIGGVWANWASAEDRRKLAGNMAAVRARNPHILILDFSCSAPYADPKDTTFPADGWLLQPNGKRIAGWPGTEMANLTKPAVIEWLAARAARGVKELGFDGTFIDCMATGFDWWACNIEHGEPYEVDADRDGKADERAALDAAWTRAKTELSRKVRDAIGPRAVFMTNQAGEWGKPSMNGILLEDYLDYVLAGGWTWDRVMREYRAWTTAPHKPVVTTIVSSSGLEPPYDAWRAMKPDERDALLERGRSLHQRMRFGLATTLMDDGYFAYDLHTRWRGQRWWYPEYDAPLGYPKGPAARQADGTWRRAFDGGLVVVNPTPFDVRVGKAGVRRDVSTGRVDDTFLVPAQDGRILLPSSETRRAGHTPDPVPPLTLAGPERIVERGDRILVRLSGAAAFFDPQGRMLSLSTNAGPLVAGISAFIVSRPWSDYAYVDVRHETLPDGTLRFHSVRQDGDFALRCEQDVRTEGNALRITWRWEALTACRFVMFRPQVDWPVSRYGGGSCAAGEARAPLPAAKGEEPYLLRGLRSARIAPARGRALTVETSSDAALVDERHYGVDAFRLGMAPTALQVQAGARWECSVRIVLPK